MNRLPKLFSVLVLLGVAVTLAAAAKPQDDLKGTVTQVYPDRQQFVLMNDKGVTETYTMEEDAPVYIDGKEASLEQLKVGSQAQVKYWQDEDMRMVIEVRGKGQ
jgi:hypothetical protein